MRRLGMEVYMSGPEEYREEGYPYMPFDELVEKMDVIMLLRVQHERHASNMQLTTAQYHERYGMTMARVNRMKDQAIIMHPAPFNRGVEIADEVVECDKSRIFEQMHNGVYVRMALLYMAIEDTKQ